MIKVIVRNNVVENIGVPSPNDGPPPDGTTVHDFDGPCSVRWLWNDGSPVDPNPPPSSPPFPDQSNTDNHQRAIKAAMLVMAQWNGKTPAQTKAAFKAAYDSLP